MSDDSNSLRREFTEAIAAAKEAVKNDLRHENTARQSEMEKDMVNAVATVERALERFESKNDEALAKLDADNKEALAKNKAELTQHRAETKEAFERLRTDIEKRGKFMMGFTVLVFGVAVALLSFILRGAIPPAG